MAIVQSTRMNGPLFSSWDALDQLCEKAFAPRLITSPLPSMSTFDDPFPPRPSNPTPSAQPIPVPRPGISNPYPIFHPMGRCGPGQYASDDGDSPLFSSPEPARSASVEKMWNDAAKMVNRSTTTSIPKKETPKVRKRRSRLNMRESSDSKSITATFDLPGVMKEDVHISYQTDRLTVTWEYVKVTETHEDNKIVRERKEKKYIRTIDLPEGIHFDQIKASMDDRRLTITYPKSQPKQAITIQKTVSS